MVNDKGIPLWFEHRRRQQNQRFIKSERVQNFNPQPPPTRQPAKRTPVQPARTIMRNMKTEEEHIRCYFANTPTVPTVVPTLVRVTDHRRIVDLQSRAVVGIGTRAVEFEVSESTRELVELEAKLREEETILSLQLETKIARYTAQNELLEYAAKATPQFRTTISNLARERRVDPEILIAEHMIEELVSKREHAAESLIQVEHDCLVQDELNNQVLSHEVKLAKESKNVTYKRIELRLTESRARAAGLKFKETDSNLNLNGQFADVDDVQNIQELDWRIQFLQKKEDPLSYLAPFKVLAHNRKLIRTQKSSGNTSDKERIYIKNEQDHEQNSRTTKNTEHQRNAHMGNDIEHEQDRVNIETELQHRVIANNDRELIDTQDDQLSTERNTETKIQHADNFSSLVKHPNSNDANKNSICIRGKISEIEHRHFLANSAEQKAWRNGWKNGTLYVLEQIRGLIQPLLSVYIDMVNATKCPNCQTSLPQKNTINLNGDYRCAVCSVDIIKNNKHPGDDGDDEEEGGEEEKQQQQQQKQQQQGTDFHDESKKDQSTSIPNTSFDMVIFRLKNQDSADLIHAIDSVLHADEMLLQSNQFTWELFEERTKVGEEIINTANMKNLQANEQLSSLTRKTAVLAMIDTLGIDELMARHDDDRDEDDEEEGEEEEEEEKQDPPPLPVFRSNRRRTLHSAGRRRKSFVHLTKSS